MAQNLKQKPFPIQSDLTRREELVSKRQEIRLTFGQMLTLWTIVAGLMVIVFFFGLHAGMDQGLKKALDEQEAAVVRLPVVANPTAPIAPVVAIQAPTVSTNEKFDFSGMVLPQNLAGSPVMGAPAPNPPPSIAPGFSGAPAAIAPIPPGTESRPAVLDIERRGGPNDNSVVVARQTRQNEAAAPSVPENELNGAPGTITTPAAKTAPKLDQKKAETKKLETKPTETANGAFSRGHYVQVVAPSSKSEAYQVVKRLSQSGIRARVQEIKVNGVLHYRVLAGPSKSRDSADMLRSRIAKSGAAGGKPFVRYLD